MAKQKSENGRRRVIEQPLEDKPGDIEALGRFIRENPVLSAGVVVFVLLCALAGLLYRVSVNVQERESATQYVEALDAEKPAEEAKELEPVSEQGGEMGELALYRMGEAAFSAGEYDKAKTAYQDFVTRYPDSAHAADALEGLGYVAENAGDFDAAAGKYEEVITRWPASFQALRQKYNIGRAREKQERFEDAIRAYRDQVAEFPESYVARQAQAALDRLRLSQADAYEKVTEVDINLDALDNVAVDEAEAGTETAGEPAPSGPQAATEEVPE